MATFPCFKCNGTGKVSFRHIANGDCFQCGATGKSRAKGFVEPHPEWVIPEAIRSTVAQWDYLAKLCDSDDKARKLIRQAGAPMATQTYVSKEVMSRAIAMVTRS